MTQKSYTTSSKMIIISKRLSYFLGLLMLLVGLSSTAIASASGSVPQSYNATASVLPGMIVELASGARNTVAPLPSSNLSAMLGVVVPINDAAIALSTPTATGQQALVASSGHYEVLVSNQDGSISTGDYLTISSLAGIGMKANPAQGEVIGQAEGNFNGKSNVLSTESIKNSLGTRANVVIGAVPVNIALAKNPLFSSSTSLPGFLSKAASDISAKPVSPARVYLSFFILIVTLILCGIMIYGEVHSGITAIGRNPLSKTSISRGLIKTTVAMLIVLAAGTLAAYLFIRL